ncbi:MAG: EBSC protein [Clostridium sp. SCN 57-10]|nr:MAG: EBSC protein [Clostridium sp. SCN 57-10]
MSVQTVKQYLSQYGKESAVREFEVSSATVELAALAVGVIPARIAKSLTFLSTDGSCIIVVAAGDAKVDNAKYKKQFGCKAKMLSPEEVLAFTGHAIGGVCPFALASENVTVYLDESLRRFDTVFPAAGSAASAVEMTCDELFVCSRAAAWVDVCKGWQDDDTEAAV